MTNNTVIPLLCHWNNNQWQSNYEAQGYWSTRNSGWSTSQFINTLNAILKYNQTQYQINICDYDDSQKGLYLIYYGNTSAMVENHGLACVTKQQVDKINQGTLKLLIVFTHETFEKEITLNKYLWNLSGLLSQMGIQRNNSVYILINTACNAITHQDPRCQLFYYPWLEAESQIWFREKYSAAPTINLKQKNKIFINLNRRVRSHRFFMVMYLLWKGINRHGYISWNTKQNPHWSEIIPPHWQRQFDYLGNNQSFFQHVQDVGTLNLQELDGCQDQSVWTGPSEYYQDSLIDLVSETHCELFGDVFMTEKTFKPIAWGLPFLFNASKNHLRHLQSLGYETFSELFDPAYDELPGGLEKIAVIGNQLANLCTSPDRVNQIKNSPEILQKLQHNQQLFWNKNHAQYLTDFFISSLE